MSHQSQYLGSEAFNQGLQINEHVNKNTGTPVIALPVATLKGVTTAINLDVAMGFQPGVLGVLGLPDGWNLAFPPS